MVAPLVYRASTKSKLKKLLFITAVVLANLYIIFGSRRHIHYSSPFQNFAVHVLLLFVFPIAIAILEFSRIEYEDNGETVIREATYLKSFGDSWWMLFMLFPAPALLLIVLFDGFSSALWSDVYTQVPRAALIWITVFVYAKIYWAMLMTPAQWRISPAGLRIGFRFVEWGDIHHVSRFRGAYEIFHNANPKLPFSYLRLDRANTALFEDYLAKNGIKKSNVRQTLPGTVQVSVALGAVLVFAIGYAAYIGHYLGPLTSVWLTFFLGYVFTYILEKVRGLSEIPLLKPVKE